jgi:hypothetical protein
MYGGIYLKKDLSIIVLGMLILTSSTAIASDVDIQDLYSCGNCTPQDVNNLSFSSVNFTDEVVYVLDHTSDPLEGNWISMGSQDGGNRIQLPQPMTITYSGPRSGNYKGVSWNLSSGNDLTYKINYPSTSSYNCFPVYLPNKSVIMSFFGNSALKGNVSIYVLNVTSNTANGVLKNFTTGNIANVKSIFHKNMDGSYKNYSAVLGHNGDLSKYNLGSFDPGQYCIVMVQNNEDGSLIVLSTTVFVVAEYELKVSAPGSIVKEINQNIVGENQDHFSRLECPVNNGSNLEINMALTNAPENKNYTYGAVLVNNRLTKQI